MLNALWFAVKVTILVTLAVWVADNPGYVLIELPDQKFKVRVHTGLFLLVLLGTILLAILIYRILKGFADFPKSFRKYRAQRFREKGHKALTLGLTAVAAGDAKIAGYQAFRAEKFLPQDKGLPKLLKAQALRLQGREDEAAAVFAELVENKDASFLGVRGLMQAALDRKDYKSALEMSYKALSLHPKQPWILRAVYDLEIRQRHWDQARLILDRAEKAKAIAPGRAASDRAAMLIAQADDALAGGFRAQALELLQKGQRFAPSFPPLIERLSGLYLETGQRRRAVRLLEKAWKASAHPALVPVWASLMAPHKSNDLAARLAWHERLVKMTPDSAEAHMALARVAIDQQLWGEARDHLARAEMIRPGMRLYKMLAELEESSGQGERAARRWLEKAADSEPGKRWVCRETGRIYDQWYPIAAPHGSFNTIAWDFPHGPVRGAIQIGQDGPSGGGYLPDAMLENPH